MLLNPTRHYSPPTVAPRYYGSLGSEPLSAPAQHYADRVARPASEAEPIPTYTEGAAADVVHSDGKIGAVVAHSTAGSRTVYPVLLKVVNADSPTPTGDTITLDAANKFFSAYSGANSKYLIIDLADLTQDMELTEVDVCDSGTPKKMLIIGSAPYTP